MVWIDFHKQYGLNSDSNKKCRHLRTLRFGENCIFKYMEKFQYLNLKLNQLFGKVLQLLFFAVLKNLSKSSEKIQKAYSFEKTISEGLSFENL